MKTSDAGLKLIMQFEGLRLTGVTGRLSCVPMKTKGEPYLEESGICLVGAKCAGITALAEC
jgi:hypothetical protein